jgi:ATP-dependent DNA helicase PIF1
MRFNDGRAPVELDVTDEEAARVLRGLQGDAPPGKPWSLEEARRSNPRAYERWTPEEDAQLERLHREGNAPKKIAAALGRRPSAIRSRLVKLGLAT